MPEHSIHAQCCFCGKRITILSPDPIPLTVRLGDGEEQELFCHLQCLKPALHPSVPLYRFETE